MDTEKRTNSHQKLPKWSPKHFKIDPKTLQNRGAARDIFRKRGVRTAKNSNKNIDLSKKRERHHSVPPFCPKKVPTWRQVGFQSRAKINKKTMQESIRKLMPFTINFLNRFWWVFGAKVEACCTKIASKTCVLRKCEKRIWS